MSDSCEYDRRGVQKETAPVVDAEAVIDQVVAGLYPDPISMGTGTPQIQCLVFRQSRESMSARNGDQSLTNPLFRALLSQLHPGPEKESHPKGWGRKILRRGPEYPSQIGT